MDTQAYNSANNNNIPGASGGPSDNNRPKAEESKQGTPSSSDNSMEEGGDFVNLGSPIAVMWFDFLMHPRSSPYAMGWSLTMCSLVILRIIAILLESCNGPNQYYQRHVERAHYYFLLNEPQYFELYIACFTPLLLDTVMRIILILLITFEPENYPVYKRFVSDRTEVAMFVCDSVCVIPFLVCAITIAPRDFLSLSQASSITLSIMELLMTCRIFRLLRNIPAIRAVSIALTNSFEHLVLPIFFFFAFNITTGVFFYFAEPCYNIDTCPWTSLFQSSFFSIVAMTTTGYGNQVPVFIISRTVAVSVMLFGSLYLSMPLAIIGNEYDKAWNRVQEEEEVLRQQKLAELTNSQHDVSAADKSDHAADHSSGGRLSSGALAFPLKKMNSADKKVMPLPTPASPSRASSPPTSPSLQPQSQGVRRMSAEEQMSAARKSLLSSSLDEKRQRVKFSAVMVIRNSLIDKLHHLHAEYKAHSRFIAPSVMIGICELRAWLPTLVLGVEEVLRSVTLFETRISTLKQDVLSISQSNSRPLSASTAPAPSPAPAAKTERRRFSVIGRGGAVINRSTMVAPHHISPAAIAAANGGGNAPYATHNPFQQHSNLLPSAMMRLSNGGGTLPPLIEGPRRNSNNNHNNHHSSSHSNSNHHSRRNSNNSNSNGNSNGNGDQPHSSHNHSPGRRRSSNHHKKRENDNEDHEEYEEDEDYEEESELGSLGSFVFSSDDDGLDDEDYLGGEDNSLLLDTTTSPQLPDQQQPQQRNLSLALPHSSSIHVSSSMDSSSTSALSTSQHPISNPLPMPMPLPVAASVSTGTGSSNLFLSPRQPAYQILEEEKSGSEEEDEDSLESSTDDVEGGSQSQSHSKSKSQSQSQSSTKKRFVSVQPANPNNTAVSTSEGVESRKASATRQSFFLDAESVSRKRARTSMYNRLVSMLKAKDPELRRRTLSEEAIERLKSVAQDPMRLRNRLWILLEFPHSSREARALQILLIFLICLSIFIMYTQTITSLTLYGESQPICGNLLELYCWDKDDSSLDPGCFVQGPGGPTAKKLKFDCDGADCFASGLNFGSGYTNMTCLNSTTLPFQTHEQLQYSYGTPLFFTSRNMMQRVSAICNRIECSDNSVGYYDASPLWIVTEFVMNAIFMMELFLRITVAQSLRSYVKDIMNFFDLLAILPFLLSIFILNKGSVSSIDFSILASSPYNFTIVLSRAFLVFRLFKLTRHFRASKVLFETAKIVWRQILGMLALLALMVLLFSIILFELEKGNSCYVGDPGCNVPESIASSVHPGDLIFIGKKGLPSQIPNIFYGVWFSYVTATTTGFSDIVPVTNGGQVMGIFLMLFGTFYMAMPLTAAASTFYEVHEKHSNPGAVSPGDGNEANPPIKAEDDVHNKANEQSNQGTLTFVPSFNQPAMLRPPPRRPSIVSETMKTQIQSAIRELRSYDRLLEEVITDLHSSPICFFDETLMRQEERKYSINSDSYSNFDDSGSVKSGTSVSTSAKNNLIPPRQMQRMRKNIAKLCKGLEDIMRSNESILIDLMFLHHAILHGDLD